MKTTHAWFDDRRGSTFPKELSLWVSISRTRKFCLLLTGSNKRTILRSHNFINTVIRSSISLKRSRYIFNTTKIPIRVYSRDRTKKIEMKKNQKLIFKSSKFNARDTSIENFYSRLDCFVAGFNSFSQCGDGPFRREIRRRVGDKCRQYFGHD